MSTDVFSPLTLPCSGRIVSNRLTKVALYEHLAKMHGGPPNKYHIGLYSEWAKHDWGMIITGNIQVSPEHLALGRDIVIPEVLNEETLAPFKKLAKAIHGEGLREPPTRPLAIVQLCHVGRQSPNLIGGRKFGVPPLAPSPVRVGSDKRVLSSDGVTSLDVRDTPHPYLRALFQQPQEMSLHDIKQVQQAFIRGASIALEAGFDGIQLHCAHGYLLAQFLNPKVSSETLDEYSVESENGIRIVREITEGVRAVVPEDFVVGVKINSADYIKSDEKASDARVLRETRRALDHVRTIALWGAIDFIEISGGDYEPPDFMFSKTRSPRQAFFSQFAKSARERIGENTSTAASFPLILLTGGLRSPAHLQHALDAGHADLLGIGRGSILRPDIPAVLRQRIISANTDGTSIASDDEPFTHAPDADIKAPFWIPRVPFAGMSVSLAWYNVRIRWIAASQLKKRADGTTFPAPPPAYRMGGTESMTRMWFWLEWHELFVGALSVCCVGVLVYHMIGGTYAASAVSASSV